MPTENLSKRDLHLPLTNRTLSRVYNRLGGERLPPATYTAGAIEVDPSISLAKLSVTGTVAFTLADGTVEGQRIALRCVVAATTPVGAVTPATFADGATLTFDAVDEAAELEWHAVGGWHLIRNNATLA